jgi:tetratricopeptide (TPR) repeat protein
MTSSTSTLNKINTALSFHKNGDWENAIISYEDLLTPQYEDSLTNQTQATLRNNIGSLYMQQEKYDLAKFHLTKAVEYMPDNSTSHYSLAILLTTKLNQHGKAIRHCHKAFTLDPNMHKAYHLMGIILQSMGKNEDAQRYFIQAETIANNNNPLITEKQIKKEDNGWEKLSIASSKIGDEFTSIVDDVSYTMTCISERPLIFKVSSLINLEECNHIINRAKVKLEDSLVMGGSDKSSSNEIDNTSYRSSHNACKY